MHPRAPLKWDFENGAVPAQWMNATGKFARGDAGAKTLVKLADNPFTKRGASSWADGHLANYTTEADVLAHEQHRQMGDAGVVAQRYQLVLFGNPQKIELQSWQPETARTRTRAFPGSPRPGTTLKLASRQVRTRHGARAARPGPPARPSRTRGRWSASIPS